MLQTNRKMLGYMIKKSGCAALLRVLRIRLVYLLLTELVSELCLDELAVEASDVGDRLVLRALSLASAGVGAVSETELLHLGDHCLSTLSCLRSALRKESELANLRAYEEHCRTVLAGCYTATATDTCSAIHSLVSVFLRNEDSVGILGLASANANVATCLHDLVECRAVYHAVLDNWECSRTPRLNSDNVAVVELTHVELAGCGTLVRSVGMTVDIE